MVAEAVKETETPVAEVEAVAPPEPASEPESTNDEEISDEALSGFLKEKGFVEEPGTEEGKDGGTSAEAKGPSLEGLTPQQILDLGKQQGKSETQTEAQAASAAYQRQREDEGVRYALSNSKTTLTQMLTQAGLDAETTLKATQLQDQLHGAWNRVLQSETQAAEAKAMTDFRTLTQQAAATALGAKGKDFLGQYEALPAAEKSSAKFYELFAEQAREGYVSPSDAKKMANAAVVAAFKKLPKDARDAIGFNPASTPANSNAVGVGSRRGTVEWASEAPIEEIMRVRAQERG